MARANRRVGRIADGPLGKLQSSPGAERENSVRLSSNAVAPSRTTTDPSRKHVHTGLAEELHVTAGYTHLSARAQHTTGHYSTCHLAVDHACQHRVYQAGSIYLLLSSPVIVFVYIYFRHAGGGGGWPEEGRERVHRVYPYGGARGWEAVGVADRPVGREGRGGRGLAIDFFVGRGPPRREKAGVGGGRLVYG